MAKQHGHAKVRITMEAIMDEVEKGNLGDYEE